MFCAIESDSSEIPSFDNVNLIVFDDSLWV